jgi:hypothetical protein
MYRTHIALILKDQRQLKRELKELCKEYRKQRSKKAELCNLIFLTMREVHAIEEEIDLLLEQAFFPYNDVPLLTLLTDERYNQSKPPGTCSPD